jgi:hypothetical protein
MAYVTTIFQRLAAISALMGGAKLSLSTGVSITEVEQYCVFGKWVKQSSIGNLM